MLKSLGFPYLFNSLAGGRDISRGFFGTPMSCYDKLI